MAMALYNKYRPKTFNEVIGQEHIVKTLINQIERGKVGHAYLFCGLRGVGKTSLARIFSKAVNCYSKKSVINLPCNECESCLSANESGLDIIEIDAASNNGVDDARDLREKIKYPPVLGKYKIYIIDEVHMLTSSAFNALLKTLEEPPSHAIFILATTEPNKLPLTVLSRCLRFDFKLVSVEHLFSLLKKVFDIEGKEYEDDALYSIALNAEGSVRDALSLADMCINLSSGALKASDTALVLCQDDEKNLDLLLKIKNADIKSCLTLLNDLILSGKSINLITKELAVSSRDLLLAKICPEILNFTKQKKEKLISFSKEFTVYYLSHLIELFLGVENSLKYSLSAKTALESAIIRTIVGEHREIAEDTLQSKNKKQEINKQEIKEDIKRAEIKEDINKSEIKQEIRVESVENKIEPIEERAESIEKINSIENKVEALNEVQLLGRIITYFRKNSTPAFFQALTRQDSSRIKIKNNTFTIFASKENFLLFCDDGFILDLERALLNQGLTYKVSIEKDNLDIDMEKEVTSFISEFGKDKVNIIS